jgi:NAD(P)-dependent dehydrogenase (short-subunit alcohol dehydrogenase family)
LYSGIGLETCILFAKEGANVLMADISAPALEKASAKLKQLVPSAHKVDIQVGFLLFILISGYAADQEGL